MAQAQSDEMCGCSKSKSAPFKKRRVGSRGFLRRSVARYARVCHLTLKCYPVGGEDRMGNLREFGKRLPYPFATSRKDGPPDRFLHECLDA